MRQASVERKTKETSVAVTINLDGTGVYDVETGIGFLDHLLEDGQLKIDLEDEITSGTLITHEGEVVNERIRGLLAARGTGSAEG